jgi:hypothetical protein
LYFTFSELTLNILVRDKDFSLHRRRSDRLGVDPASYSMGTRGLFPGDKAVGA